MSSPGKLLTKLYILQPLAKGFTIFYSVLLTILYVQHVITSKQVGYFGAIFIVALILSTFIVVRKLHNLETKQLLTVAGCSGLLASTILFFGVSTKNQLAIACSYAVMGLASGLAMSGVNAVAAHATTRGDRFFTLAKIGSITDVLRIVFPVAVAGMVAIAGPWLVAVAILLAGVVFQSFVTQLQPVENKTDVLPEHFEKLKSNIKFRFVMILEFIDSFSSSQLFIFLPLLFIARGYSLEKSLLLQAMLFAGYFAGRWLIGYFAKRYNPTSSIMAAELGMIACIILLLLATNIVALYVLTLLLGIFTRGTSPTIKAMAFDTLEDHQIKQGSAAHVLVGDTGSACGQLAFGFIIAWTSIQTVFVVAACAAALVVVAGLLAPKSVKL